MVNTFRYDDSAKCIWQIRFGLFDRSDLVCSNSSDARRNHLTRIWQNSLHPCLKSYGCTFCIHLTTSKLEAVVKYLIQDRLFYIYLSKRGFTIYRGNYIRVYSSYILFRLDDENIFNIKIRFLFSYFNELESSTFKLFCF